MSWEGGGIWIAKTQVEALEAEGTTAFRVWSGGHGWVERFGRDYLISGDDSLEAQGLAARVLEWSRLVGREARRVFFRKLVKQPREEDVPVLLMGAPGVLLVDEVMERGLRFEVDFGAGYSVGLFCDQRGNRARLEELRPRRVLNTFAYTCAFSVAAARAGAETLSVDLSRKSLERGRRNLMLNGFQDGAHRFIADDVFAVLPRLAKRGERFDGIVLDPPTFSRGARGRVFRATEDFGRLVELAVALAAPGAWLLLSTNARELELETLCDVARRACPGARFERGMMPADYRQGEAATTVWMFPGGLTS